MSTTTKKVLVGNVEVTPLTAKQHRRLEERIKKRHEKLRNRYGEIHGKVVDWVSYSFEDTELRGQWRDDSTFLVDWQLFKKESRAGEDIMLHTGNSGTDYSVFVTSTQGED